MKTDYLIVGSGLSALVFGALMAKAGQKVVILEAHEHPGGFGHTFTMANKYTFNAQLHYVWDCGEGAIVNRVLKTLNLDRKVTFERYDPNGFDRMKIPGYELKIPADFEKLNRRLSALFSESSDRIDKFILEVQKTLLNEVLSVSERSEIEANLEEAIVQKENLLSLLKKK